MSVPSFGCLRRRVVEVVEGVQGVGVPQLPRRPPPPTCPARWGHWSAQGSSWPSPLSLPLLTQWWTSKNSVSTLVPR